MSKIITPAYSINKPTHSIALLSLVSSREGDYQWPGVLIDQHNDLDVEIESVNALLSERRCSLIQLDMRLKRLTKGLLTHLELEANFLTPILGVSTVSSQQENYLNQGFDALFTACKATTEYIHSLKVISGHRVITEKQAERVGLFLKDIKERLNDEEIIYYQIAENEGSESEV